jgi:hypothetical protein
VVNSSSQGVGRRRTRRQLRAERACFAQAAVAAVHQVAAVVPARGVGFPGVFPGIISPFFIGVDEYYFILAFLWHRYFCLHDNALPFVFF